MSDHASEVLVHPDQSLRASIFLLQHHTTMLWYAILCLSISPCAVFARSPKTGVGITYQNWNCCKPSCAWPGKANVSAPAKSCDINNQPLTDANVGTSCQNGPSYMCADQAPWVVNPDLAYGFAASTIEGESEDSWCCACYDLTFMSGPSKGRRMIVQATDTDLGATNPGSQFVLAVTFNLRYSYIIKV